MKVRNIAWLRGLRLQGQPDFGPRMHELVADIVSGQDQIAQQTNTSTTAQPLPPPQLSNIKASGGNGIFHVSLTHPGEFYRGAQYHLEYSADPQFGVSFPISAGASREWRGSLGKMVLHFRAATSYGTSPPSAWVYSGPVDGTGPSDPSLPAQSQGSGTGHPGQGLQGSGVNPYRGTAPPIR